MGGSVRTLRWRTYPRGDASPAGISIFQICLLLANGANFGRFASGSPTRPTRAVWEFGQKPEFSVPEAMVIRVFHVGPGNLANRTLLIRSEGLLHGTVRARKGGAIFRISGSHPTHGLLARIEWFFRTTKSRRTIRFFEVRRGSNISLIFFSP